MMTNDSLSKSALKVQEALTKKGLKLRVLELSSSARTANEAAQSIGCSVAQIVKSLLFRTKQTNKPILVLASGVNRVNEKKISDLIGEEIVKADADFTKATTGFVIGGVPPIGHLQGIETFIDQDLFKFEELWAAAGAPNAVFCLKATDLQSLTNGKIIAIN